MFFPASAPPADLITLHKSTVMHIKHPSSECSPQVLDSVSGDVRPFEGNFFPLIHYGGSFFFPPSFHFSPHGAGQDLSRGLMSSQAASASFCLSAAAGSVGCKIEDSGQRLCGF